MTVAPLLLGLGLAVGLIVLLPARRLHLAGVSPRWIGAYALGLWLLACAVAVRPVAARFLIPIVLIAWIAPFVVAPDRLGQVLRRPPPDPPRPPMKNVTPPGDDSEPG